MMGRQGPLLLFCDKNGAAAGIDEAFFNGTTKVI
jgi:hypothetical protein